VAGEAAFMAADSGQFGRLNDPKRSNISGKVAIAPFPKGPRARMEAVPAWISRPMR